MPKPRKSRLDDLPEILTVDDLMGYLGFSRNTVYALLKQGEIRAIGGNGPNRFCRSWRVSKKALIEYLDRPAERALEPADSP